MKNLGFRSFEKADLDRISKKLPLQILCDQISHFLGRVSHLSRG